MEKSEWTDAENVPDDDDDVGSLEIGRDAVRRELTAAVARRCVWNSNEISSVVLPVTTIILYRSSTISKRLVSRRFKIPVSMGVLIDDQLIIYD